MRRPIPFSLPLSLVVPVLLLAGCQSLQSSDSFLGVITPYRIDVVQGNVLTKEQVAQVQPGMTRNQVRDVLGSPLLTDPFHDDRWDYVFTIRRPGTEPRQRKVVAHFDGDVLKRLDAGELPSEREFIASINTFKPSRSIPPLELSDEQRKALPAPAARPESAASAPEGATRAYPPLEPSATP